MSTNRFNDYVKSVKPFKPRLPLLHTSDGYGFREIVDSSQLEAKPHKIAKKKREALLFLFYGKPAYRTARLTQASTSLTVLPVCIVLDPDTALDLKRIIPFDSGAFDQDMFQAVMDDRLSLKDFFLKPSIDMPARVVRLFYGSNKSYFRGQPASVKIPASQFEAQCYYDLICSAGMTPYDDRCSTIEMQCAQSVKLTENNVLLIVLPQSFLDDVDCMNAIVSQWSANKAVGYPVYRTDPNHYVMIIYEIVERFLKEKGYTSQ